MLASGDADKVITLERSPIKLYWEVAQGYAKRLLAEQERVKRANKKRHGR